MEKQRRLSLSRRRLPLAGAMLLAGCGPSSKPARASRVMIARAETYDDRLYAIIRRMLEELRPDVRGKRVLLKPNLVEFDPSTCINTNPIFVHAVLEGFRSLGAASVRIAEGPGHRRVTLDLAEAAGYFKVIPDFDALFTDLNLDDCTKVALADPKSQLKEVFLPNTVLGAEMVVSLPKMKTHHWVGATLSMKNLFGIVPGAIYGWPKNILHWAGIPECIVDLHALLPVRYALVDGIDGMEGNGPIQGTKVAAGVVIAGDNMPAVDATASRVMGIDPLQLPYLTSSVSEGDLNESAILQAGDSIRSVRKEFSLIPLFQHLRWKPA